MLIPQALSESCPASRVKSNGFSLPELLVATIIAAGITIITAQVIIGQLLQGRRLEVAQRFRENVSRLNYLVQIEASEADEVDTGAQPVGCVLGADGFALLIPRPTGQYADPSNRVGVRYYNAVDPDDGDGGGLHIWRCGPPVSRNGVLIYTAANESGIVMRDAQLQLDPDGCTSPTTETRVTYRVVPAAGLEGARLGELGGCVTAHARSIFVCNPPLGSGGEIGDCP